MSETVEEPETVLFPDLSIFEELETEDIETKPQLSAWAKSKIGTFQSRLEAIKVRDSQRYRKYRNRKTLTRLLVALINDSFGFNGWSSSIIDCCSVAEEYDEQNATYTIKQKAKVQIMFQDGTVIDAEGTGITSGCREKSVGYSSSKKMAVSDGLRNAIMLFADLVST